MFIFIIFRFSTALMQKEAFRKFNFVE